MDRKTRSIFRTVMGTLWLLVGVAGTVMGRQDTTVSGMFVTIGIIILVFSGERAISAEVFQWWLFRKGDLE
ncbi:hypothetical protein RJ40_06930 [Methanofollis aquaemaris]|uniref:Uncharacterized protein n=1 Tax=Methanofollis aquaemaris TaxID=126734 RepID=A0A8A3S5Q6_9EURY|nr:hypothetical protein [Methanofollis aquaemaris]QSZ67253.1 hypothetical protein RJ40_06930 [Methanofollis aquaemaris]